MATFPTYVKILIGSSESPKSVVMRSEMERGVPKQRRLSSDSMVTVPVDLFFETAQYAYDFEDWFYSEIGGGTDWFDWVNPRSKTTVQARIVGGEIGALTPATGVWSGFTTRKINLEYVRFSNGGQPSIGSSPTPNYGSTNQVLALGVDQTWSDLPVYAGANYQNSTTKPIIVTVNAYADDGYLAAYVDGNLCQFSSSSSYSNQVAVSIVVPSGSSFSFEGNNYGITNARIYS